MKTYPKYKPTNIEWIGELPHHWENTIVKRITKRHKQGYYSTDDYIDEGVKLIRITDLNSKGDITYEKCPSVVINEKDEEIFTLNEGDFLFPRTGSIGSFGFVKNPERSVFASYLISFSFYENLAKSNFLKFYFTSNFYLDGLFSDLHGGVNQNIHAENIKDRKIFLPPLPEQQAIVSYLDQKTTLIDELIAKKQRKIELLKENRTALINHAVTKGLDPTVKYKDTGIEWIGEIPEHWGKSKVKWELTFHNNRRVPIEAEIRGNLQGEFPYYGASGIIDYVNEYIFDGEYILVGEDGANILSRSTPLAFLATGKFWVNNHAHILKANNQQDKYFAIQIELNDFTTKASGSAQPKLTKEAIGDLELIVPPTKVQQQIVDYLDTQTALIDQNINLELQKIEKLKEYRQSLISNVVTGKICVLED